MQYEMWLRPRRSVPGKLLHMTMDPAEMYVHYKDAMRVYPKEELQLLAGSEWDIYEVDHRWLRQKVLRTSVLK